VAVAWDDDPRAKAYLRRAQRDLLPMMRDSEVIMSLYHGEPDAKLAIETGFAVLLDKPIVGLVTPGTHAARKFIAVCDELIEADMTTAAGRQSAQTRLAEAMRRLGLDGK
jgi:hypothetical protein